jgi:transmembrane sensor
MEKKEIKKFEDFILDESFREYVAHSDEKSVAFWTEWINDHEYNQEDFQKATDVLNTLLNTKKIMVPTDRNEELSLLLEKIHGQKEILPFQHFITTFWARAAAVIILSMGLAWLWNTVYINKHLNDKLVYNEIIVPVGEKSQIILSDGTHVWINSGSSFKYPADFTNNDRDVILEGEAYFDVTKKPGKNFIVNTRDVRIQVLGTAFNVKSYPEDKKTQTTVIRGLVRVESKISKEEPILIYPDQMATIHDEPRISTPDITTSSNNLIITDDVNTAAITSWKDQLLVFADETFEDIAIKMERWYNVKISILDNELKQERYNGKFVHNETIYEVLEAIKITTPINYSVTEEGITITRKKTN